ncbi:hypothetical protein SAMN04487912_1174 [Arthrobacter sp. cf158]|uniref:hypothetical protein n=1 Tax=Arthrobacter sp. cf158 TaxID=1761744 RepID=UPI00089572D0|nr:hypothetical protein [Arthrobacter sp. cf158]SDX56046.1 hypothetical protein SAMN04487912_1174 [Arthrobacter sp. cf158]
MSIPIPSPSDLPTAEPTVDDGKRSRKGRTSIGVGLLVIGALAAVGMAWSYWQYGPMSGTLSASDLNDAVIADALRILFILALLAGGIWNVVTRRSQSKVPVVVALVLSILGLGFAVINVIDLLMTFGKMPNLFGLLIYVGLTIETVRVLRLKQAPAPLTLTQPGQLH